MTSRFDADLWICDLQLSITAGGGSSDSSSSSSTSETSEDNQAGVEGGSGGVNVAATAGSTVNVQSVDQGVIDDNLAAIEQLNAQFVQLESQLSVGNGQINEAALQAATMIGEQGLGLALGVTQSVAGVAQTAITTAAASTPNAQVTALARVALFGGIAVLVVFLLSRSK